MATRSAIPFPTFMYDSMIMQYGLQQIAIKVLCQLTNGLKQEQEQNQFAHMMYRLLGLALPPMRLDEIAIVVRAHTFFKLVQWDWVTKMRTNYKMLEITSDMESNLNTGGDCSVFDILDNLKTAFHGDPLIESVMSTIKPDILLTKCENKEQLSLEFSVLKIVNKIAKSGKSVEKIFDTLCVDGRKSCKYFFAENLCSDCGRDHEWPARQVGCLLHQRGNRAVDSVYRWGR